MKLKLRTKSMLCSPDKDGTFDFTNSVILLNKYSSTDRKLIRSALKPTTFKGKLIPDEMDAYNLCIHEYTHYLDLTTTVWGVGFIARRSLALSNITTQGAKAVSMAMLNISEIKMHDEFNCVDQKLKLTNLTTKHSLEYSERHGAVIIIHLFMNDTLVAKTSISMLSILESNAVANEYEGEYKWVACTNGEISSFQDQRINAKFNKLLEDGDRLEYNIIHILVAIHFHKQALTHRLKLVSMLCDIALNISAPDLARFANIINDRDLKNRLIGDVLCNDLCGGMSRHAVVFYLILMLYEYINAVGLTDEQVSQYIEESFFQLIDIMLMRTGFSSPLYWCVSDLEFSCTIQVLRKKRDCRKFILCGSIRAALFNRKLLHINRSTSQAFRRLKLPDIILDDHSKIRAPSRIKASVLAHWDSIYDECRALDNAASNPDIMKKSHMLPNERGPMQERRMLRARYRPS